MLKENRGVRTRSKRSLRKYVIQAVALSMIPVGGVMAAGPGLTSGGSLLDGYHVYDMPENSTVGLTGDALQNDPMYVLNIGNKVGKIEAAGTLTLDATTTATPGELDGIIDDNSNGDNNPAPLVFDTNLTVKVGYPQASNLSGDDATTITGISVYSSGNQIQRSYTFNKDLTVNVQNLSDARLVNGTAQASTVGGLYVEQDDHTQFTMETKGKLTMDVSSPKANSSVTGITNWITGDSTSQLTVDDAANLTLSSGSAVTGVLSHTETGGTIFTHLKKGINIQAQSDGTLAQGLEEGAGVPGDSADHSMNLFSAEGPVTISVSSNTPIPVGQAVGTVGIEGATTNSGDIEASFSGPVQVTASNDNDAYGLHVMASDKGTTSYTFNDSANFAVKTKGTTGGTAVRAESSKDGSATLTFNKGLTISEGNTGIYAVTDLDTSNLGKSTTVAADGGPITIGKVYTPVADLSTAKTGAVISSGQGASVTINGKGSQAVQINGSVIARNKGTTAITLDSASSHLNGDMGAFTGGSLTITSKGQPIVGMATDGSLAGATQPAQAAQGGMISLNLSKGASWALTQSSDVSSLVNDGGHIDMTTIPEGTAGRTLTVKNLSGNDGTINMALTGDDKSEKVQVLGTFTGKENLIFAGIKPSDTAGLKGKVVAQVKDNQGTFTGIASDGLLGKNKVELAVKDSSGADANLYTKDWYIKDWTIIRPTADHPSAAMVPFLTNAAETENLWNDAFLQDVVGQHVSSLDAKGGLGGFWFGTEQSTVKGEGSLAYSKNEHHYYAGYDKVQATNRGRLVRGASLHWLDSQKEGADGTTLSGAGLSLYQRRAYDNGVYADLSLRIQRLNGQLDKGSESSPYGIWGTALSFAYGKQLSLSPQTSVEPYGRLVLGHLSGYSTEIGGMTDSVGDNTSFWGGLGVRLNCSLGHKGHLHVGYAMAHSFTKGASQTFTTSDDSFTLDGRRPNTWQNVELGLTYTPKPDSQLYASLDKRLGTGESSRHSWQAGFKLGF